MTIRRVLFAMLLGLLACKGGECDSIDEFARCAQACKPRGMRSYRTAGGLYEPSRCECADDAVDAGSH